jgi:hypothetical protein
LQDYRVQEYLLPSPPSIKCNVLCESLSEDSQNIPCEGNLYISLKTTFALIYAFLNYSEWHWLTTEIDT